jgi:putative hydrolase of the HAD superfamily
LAAAEQALYAWLQEAAGRVAARHDLDGLRAHRMELRLQRPDIAHDLTALRLQSLAMLLEEAGYPAWLAREGLDLFLYHRNRVSPYRDAAPVLRRLRQSYRLVSVTNGNADVERTPLRGHFHRAFRAQDVGAAKPDPALFAAVLAWAQASPAQALHVGDDPFLDVEAARSLGMRAVWINRSDAEWPLELPPPELEARDLYGLLRWLGGLA